MIIVPAYNDRWKGISMLKQTVSVFIGKNNSEITPELRRGCGVICGCTGIFFNLLLFLGKIFAGAVSSSVAITADAFNNLSDAGSSVVSMLGFKLAGQKPDSFHPFGHGRMEYVAGLIVSMLIILMGVELMQTGIKKIISPEPVSLTAASVIILALSIAVKLFMFTYNRIIGRRIDSVSMKATAMDSLSDVCATAVVLISTLTAHFTGLDIDGWCGLAVALFILYAGCRAAYDTVSPLLGQKPSSEFVDSVKQSVLSHKEIIGVHDIVVHNYGPECVMITLHAEVPADGDLLELHDVVDTAEKELEQSLNCTATIHMDPIADDNMTREMRAKAALAVKRIDPRISIHDFRVSDCKNRKRLEFDALIPFGMDISDEELEERIRGSVLEETGCETEVKVEKGFV